MQQRAKMAIPEGRGSALQSELVLTGSNCLLQYEKIRLFRKRMQFKHKNVEIAA